MTAGSPLGDVLRAWHWLGASDPETRARTAAMLGLNWVPRVKMSDIPLPRPSPPIESAVLRPIATEPKPEPPRPITVEVTTVAADSMDASTSMGNDAMKVERKLAPFPPKEPLLNPTWTRGIFSSRLSQSVLSRRIDHAAILQSELRARPLERLPWRRTLTMSGGVRCFIDTGAPLDILAEDRAQVLRALRALAGFERVSVGFFETVPDGPDARIDSGSEFFAAPESPLLLLTDFGHYGLSGRRWALPEEWLAFIERERARGTRRIVALTPVPRSDWPTALLPEMEIALWDWETGVGRSRRDAR